MNLHENGGIEHHRHPGFDVENTAASIHEIELQLERGEISRDRYLEKKAALVSIYPVSYTHLDVYKRQLQS